MSLMSLKIPAGSAARAAHVHTAMLHTAVGTLVSLLATASLAAD